MRASRTPSVGLVLGVVLTVGSADFACAREIPTFPPQRPAPAAQPKHLAGYERVRPFGGPSSVASQLHLDHRVGHDDRWTSLSRAVQPLYDWKARLQKRHGLSFGLDYNVFYQVATTHLPGGPDQALGGVFRFYGRWAPVCRGSDFEGAFVWKVENRSALGTDVSPNGLGPAVGSLFPSTATFSDWGWGVTNLQWQQRFRIGQAHGGFALGQVDVTDWLDVFALGNPWTGFANIIPITFATKPAPDQGLGAVAFLLLRKKNTPYVMAGVSDANGEPTRVGFDTLFDVGELFTYAEIGWTPSYEQRFDNAVHVTCWHQDARTEAGTPEGWGISASGIWRPDGSRWQPFAHVGWSEGDAWLAEAAVTVGTGLHLGHDDLLGFSATWARPAGDELRDQYTLDLFYRWVLGPHAALTPDVQLIVDPSDNPTEDVLGLLGLRLRINF